MRFFSAHEIEAKLPYKSLIEKLRAGFKAGAQVPLRHHHSVNGGMLLLMPAFNSDYLGTKIVSVFGENAKLNKPAVYGNYFLSNGSTGEPLAVLEGQALTSRRTAAASALASSYLSNPDSKILLMVGAGALAQPLIEAHCAVRNFKRILLYNRSPERALELKAKLPHIEIVSSLEKAAREADVISCATLSSTPLIKGEWLKACTHLDLVGGFTPTMREADDACLQRATLFVDTFDGGLHEAGDIVEPLSRGIIIKPDVKADLFALTRGEHKGRSAADEITLFKSVGTALEDLIAAITVYET